MIKILLPLTLLLSTLGIQAASAAAPCTADVKRMAANAAASASPMKAPYAIECKLHGAGAKVTETVINWILQNPAVHKDAVAVCFGESKPVLLHLLDLHADISAFTLLLDLCPNVLATTCDRNWNRYNYLHCLLEFRIKPKDPAKEALLTESIRKVVLLMHLQGASFEKINQQAQGQIDHYLRDCSPIIRAQLYTPEMKQRLQVVFDKVRKLRQELGEATECDKALQAILPLELRAINRTYITDLPAPKQP